jgi:hypothetical protein
MHGLSVRWSLEDAPDGVEQSPASYVEGAAGFLAAPAHV